MANEDSIYKMVQVRALANVMLDSDDNPDAANFFQRTVNRWYSKEFHTPLHLVSQLPLAEIMLHYWESIYEQLEGPQLEQERIRLTETATERLAREAAEEADKREDDEIIAKITKDVQHRLLKKGEKIGQESEARPSLSSKVVRPNASAKSIKEATLPGDTTPVMRMVFEEDAQVFEREMEADGMAPPPRAKK